jgi:hypothetical protein
VVNYDADTIPFVETLPPLTRITMCTPDFDYGAVIPVIEYFPLINCRDVEVTFWETEVAIPDNFDPLGFGARSIGTDYSPNSNRVPFFVGDGFPLTIYLNAVIRPGAKFAVSFNNTNPANERPINLLAHIKKD